MRRATVGAKHQARLQIAQRHFAQRRDVRFTDTQRAQLEFDRQRQARRQRERWRVGVGDGQHVHPVGLHAIGVNAHPARTRLGPAEADTTPAQPVDHDPVALRRNGHCAGQRDLDTLSGEIAEQTAARCGCGHAGQDAQQPTRALLVVQQPTGCRRQEAEEQNQRHERRHDRARPAPRRTGLRSRHCRRRGGGVSLAHGMFQGAMPRLTSRRQRRSSTA